MATSYQPAAGNASLLGALLQPHTNYPALSAARSEALQLGAYNAQLQQQQALETQAAAADQQAYIDKLNSIQFMGRDVAKLQAHVKNEERQVFKEIKEDYAGDVRQWYKVRGQQWMNGAATRLKQSPFYQQAVQNVQNVAMGQEALAKGEMLAGNGDMNNYQTGEQRLQDFLAGRSDAYQHTGSFKREDDMKFFRDQYAAGVAPWLKTPVSEKDKLASLVDQHGAVIGVDKYLRQHKDIPTYYKTDPVTKKYDFERDQGRYVMEKGRYGMAVQDHAQLSGLRNKQGQLLDLKIKEKKGEAGGNGIGFVEQQLRAPSQLIEFAHNPSALKQLPSGLNIGQLRGLAGTTLFGKADDVLTRQLGLQRTKDGWTKGRITEGFTDQNGVHGFDLRQSNFKTVSIDPTVFYNPADANLGGLNKNGVHGFARVTVQFATPQDAEKAGLYNPNRVFGGTVPTSLFDTATPSGTGVYNPESMTATFFTPTGKIDPSSNPGFGQAWRKATRGQKDANEDADLLPLDTTF